MTKYLVHYNENQDSDLDALKKSHGDSHVSGFDVLIQKLCDLIRNDGLQVYNAQVWRDSLLGSLRRVRIAKSEFDKIPFGFLADSHDLRMSWALVFFQNSKVFVETVKSNFNSFSVKKYKHLLRDITEVRNYFAHDYNKDHLGGSCVVRIDPNHHFNDGLIKLELMELESSERVGEVFISLDVFFREINNFLNELVSFIDKKK